MLSVEWTELKQENFAFFSKRFLLPIEHGLCVERYILLSIIYN